MLLRTTSIAMAGRIRATQAKISVRFGQYSITVTCSVGYATGGAGEPTDGLVSRAGKALYRAKVNGRNRFEPLIFGRNYP